MEKIMKIAFATDFSEGAELAFARALEIAQNNHSQLFLVHVLPQFTQPIPLLNELAMGSIPGRLREDMKEAALRELDNMYAQQCLGLDKVHKVLLEGDPAKALGELAFKEDLDLLVVGSTGLSGLAKAMFGSVAAKVVQKAPCSVLVVRRKKTA